jgi:uncharacterized membrane protein
VLQRIDLIIDIPSGFSFSSRLPLWPYYLMFALLILNTNLAENTRPVKMRAGSRLVMLALALAIYFLVLLASVNWTAVGSLVLVGVQGRYFTPLIPLLALAFSGIIRPTGEVGRTSLYLFCCLNGMEVFFAFMSII